QHAPHVGHQPRPSRGRSPPPGEGGQSGSWQRQRHHPPDGGDPHRPGDNPQAPFGRPCQSQLPVEKRDDPPDPGGGPGQHPGLPSAPLPRGPGQPSRKGRPDSSHVGRPDGRPGARPPLSLPRSRIPGPPTRTAGTAAGLVWETHPRTAKLIDGWKR
ncbi:MAG: hypothetical protein D084_Lepto4C00279G0002, partial [Leptospirillum sp. Group IV 'UBA BS']